MTIAEMIRKRRAWAQWRQASKPIGGREIDDIVEANRALDEDAAPDGLPFARRATTNAINCDGVASPARMVPIAARHCAALRSRRASNSESSVGQPPNSSSRVMPKG